MLKSRHSCLTFSAIPLLRSTLLSYSWRWHLIATTLSNFSGAQNFWDFIAAKFNNCSQIYSVTCLSSDWIIRGCLVVVIINTGLFCSYLLKLLIVVYVLLDLRYVLIMTISCTHNCYCLSKNLTCSHTNWNSFYFLSL